MSEIHRNEERTASRSKNKYFNKIVKITTETKQNPQTKTINTSKTHTNEERTSTINKDTHTLSLFRGKTQVKYKSLETKLVKFTIQIKQNPEIKSLKGFQNSNKRSKTETITKNPQNISLEPKPN